jgi:Ser/Thr protein kinase RdoA (MazF antagonist)
VDLDVRAWNGVVIGDPVIGGHRNEVWTASTPSGPVAIRRSRRSEASLLWELELIEWLDNAGFVVPVPMHTVDGRLSCDGVVVQRWLGGREPTTDDDWRLVAAELVRLHDVCSGWAQRPTCLAVTQLGRSSRSVDADLAAVPEDVVQQVLAVFAEFREAPVSVIHGDPDSSNIRITEDGRVGFIDWDESRVDVVFHLGCQILDDSDHARAGRLSDAWETINAWTAEPEYARSRLADLRRQSRG